MTEPARLFPESTFALELEEEVSGVRPIPVLEVDVTIDAAAHEPAAAFAVMRGVRQRVFLGVSFAEGVLENPDWAVEMRQAGASASAIEQCAAWLRLHCI